MEKKLIERNNENTTLNRDLQMMTEDRDFWKSQYEQFTENFDPDDAKLEEKIKVWASKKMLHNKESYIELQKLKDRIDYINQEEALEILVKTAEINKETKILCELGVIILEIMNKD